MRFRDKILSFLYGRYGIDTLYYFLLGALLILSVIRLFVGNIAGVVLSLLEALIFITIFFRMFSRNINARRRENEVFMRFFRRIKAFFSHQITKIRDRKVYRYKKCPSCKAMLRLPAKSGKHTAVCPKCKCRFEVNNRF